MSKRERAAWERVMRRLRVCTAFLGAVLLALAARVVVSGVTFAAALSGVIVLALLVASLLLTRHGRRLEPPPQSHPGHRAH
ncbi:MAG TPA: hypothetical protein VHT29_10510 [Solirubrobacteraceae bacterium]|jgi:hypothetical protein|nr:hypothetical protein [Solirubrobacteraceae bacterium]